MKYIHKIYEDGRATAIPVKQIVHVDLDVTEYTKKWYVDVHYTPSRGLSADMVRMCEVESRNEAYGIYLNILDIIAEES